MLRRLIVQVVVDGFALWLSAQGVDGVPFDGNLNALVLTALAFSIVKLVIRPFVILLTLPLTILTFGLFLPVVNALMLMLTSAISQSYTVDSFGAAFVGGLLISLVNMAMGLVTGNVGDGHARRSGR